MNREMIYPESPVAPGAKAPRFARARRALAVALVVLAALACAAPMPALAEPARSAKADGILKNMSDYMAGLKSFSVRTTNTMEYIDTDGQKLDFTTHGDASVVRPDRLVAHRTGANQGASIYYDGKNVTVYSKRENLYAVAPTPAGFDNALDFMRDLIQLDVPGADLLYSDIDSGLTWDEIGSSYIGKEAIDGKSVDHLAFRTRDVDFQIWIQDGDRPLPMRYLITSKWVTGAPQFGVEMSDWVVNPRLSEKTFEFKPPAGATKIDFVTREGAQP